LAETLELDLECDGHVDDIEEAQSTGLNEGPEFQYRAKWLAETSEFRHWLDSKKSGMLYAQGDGEQDSVSPISFLAALLHAKLLESDDVLVLPFFCGLHTGGQFKDSDEMRGPLIMIRALLTQLLNLEGVDWANGSDGYPYLSLKPDDISRLTDGFFSTYLKLFNRLLAKLLGNYKAVFILLDGLDWYDSTWKRDVTRLRKSLLRMTTSKQTVGVLKVFLGAATHLDSVPETDDDLVCVEIPEEIDGEGDSYEDIE